jgi:Acetyltransferase (GNAT) family
MGQLVIRGLEVDRSAQGTGLGRLLLADAIQRTLGASEQVAMHAIVVDAKNQAAHQFYQAYGFLALSDQPMRLFLPLRFDSHLIRRNCASAVSFGAARDGANGAA